MFKKTSLLTPSLSEGKIFPGPIALLKEAWDDYRRHFYIYVGIIVLAAVVFFVSMSALAGVVAVSSSILSGMSVGVQVVGILLSLVFGLGFLLLMVVSQLWSTLALVVAIRDRHQEIGIKTAYGRSRGLVVPYFWVWVLMALIPSLSFTLSFLSFTVSFLGFVLFIIPGLIFVVWVSLALYVLVVEDRRGLDVLLACREYVRDYWWGVLGRMLFIILFGFFITFLNFYIFALVQAESLGNFVNFIVQLLLTPLFILYSYVLYTHLRRIKGEISTSPRLRHWFVGLSAVSTVVLILIMGFVLWIGLGV